MIKKIMLVDDDPSTNFYHKIILEESQLVEEITICEDADEAIAALKTSDIPPDIIYLDINMPRKTGWDFLTEYASLPMIKRAGHVIVLSTTRLPIDVERANAHPLVDDFFTKPLTLDMVGQFVG